MRLGQQQTDAAVFNHIGQAFSRVFRVERHVGAPGLENRQQANHQLQRTLARHAHAHFRTHSALAQLMRQTVGALIEIAITQRLPGKHQRTSLRCGRRLRFDVLVHAGGAGIVLLGGIQAIQRGLYFMSAEHRQLADRAFRVRHHTSQQGAPMRGHGFNARGIEQISGIGQAGQQVLAFFMGIELQIKLSGAARPFQALDLQADEHPAQCAGAALLVVEHHLKQGTVAQAALPLQGIDQPFEGHVLITLGIQCAVTGLA